jgi:CheY-like chemotaxis protein
MNSYPIADTILLVEDDADIGDVLLHVLQNETSYQVILVTSGVEALQHIHQIHPCLFLLDYSLPSGMNGIELYDYLHTMKGLETVPALMISANVPKHEAEKRRLPILHKPFDIDMFLQTIEQLLA